MKQDLVTVIGDDELSRAIVGDCEALGIGLEHSKEMNSSYLEKLVKEVRVE